VLNFLISYTTLHIYVVPVSNPHNISSLIYLPYHSPQSIPDFFQSHPNIYSYSYLFLIVMLLLSDYESQLSSVSFDYVQLTYLQYISQTFSLDSTHSFSSQPSISSASKFTLSTVDSYHLTYPKSA
jgi:hypothetical protein